MKNIVLGIFTVVTMLLISSSSLFAQNLIVNGDFEQTSGFNYNVISDYRRITGGAVESGCFIHDVTSTGHGSGDLGGWPTNLTGYGGSGYYLLFNGFGNSENPTKVAWRQTVNVTSHTTYTFSCQLRNLSQSFFGFNANTAIIRIKINGNTAGQDVTFSISNHDWQEVTRTWNSGNVSGPITIEIFDVFTGAPNSGDDFGLDHISFTPTTVYSVDAIDDPDISVCLDQFVYVDVLVNDVVAPEPSDADVSIVEDPSWGDAEVLPDKRIRYKYTGGGNGTDQIKYQVTNHNALDEAWVYINTSSPPFVGNIDNPDPICAGNSFNLTIPTIQNNGSTIINQGWQIAASQNGSYSDFNNDNVPYTYNNYWIRYYAINNCDTTYCESIEVTVNDSPIVGAITAPEGICEGEAFSLTTPSVTWRHNDLSTCSGSWEIQINGVWEPLINQNIPFEYNGCLIRFKAVNGCDTTYSPNNAQITVYSSAPINEGEIIMLPFEKSKEMADE